MKLIWINLVDGFWVFGCLENGGFHHAGVLNFFFVVVEKITFTLVTLDIGLINVKRKIFFFGDSLE